ncbi:hypothetical protein Hanom_Chr10g00876241 [Helianthus anomalus]
MCIYLFICVCVCIYRYILIKNNNSSRVELSLADICSCFARIQVEPNEAAHLQPSLKSSEQFPSERRAVWTSQPTTY